MLFLTSKIGESFENLVSYEYASNYQIPWGSLSLIRRQFQKSRSHERILDRYKKNGDRSFFSSLGDVSFLPFICSKKNCQNGGIHGAHIRRTDRRSKIQFLVVLCPSCNADPHPFELKPSTPLLILGSVSKKKHIDFTDAKIRFLHHTITLSLPTPSTSKIQ